MSTLIEWAVMKNRHWKIYIAKTPKGLCYVGSPGESFERFSEYLKKRFPGCHLEENGQALEPYRQQLLDCISGAESSFTLPIDAKGTPFQRDVWQALQQIPFGQTVPYSEIAALVGRPTAIRAVGTAIGANPVLIAVPCHRVIGKNGAISGYRGGLELKRYLLELEAGQHEQKPSNPLI